MLPAKTLLWYPIRFIMTSKLFVLIYAALDFLALVLGNLFLSLGYPLTYSTLATGTFFAFVPSKAFKILHSE